MRTCSRAERSFQRQMPRWRTIFGTLIVALGLVSCVSISTETSVSVLSSETQSIIYIEVPNKSIEFNWHGGGWWNGVDRYKITVPRRQDHSTGKEIQMAMESSGVPQPVSDLSEVWISGKGPCEVRVKLFDANGKPYRFNGSYKTFLECKR